MKLRSPSWCRAGGPALAALVALAFAEPAHAGPNAGKLSLTAGAVSSSLDLGLHLVKKHFGPDEHARISKAMHHARRTP